MQIASITNAAQYQLQKQKEIAPIVQKTHTARQRCDNFFFSSILSSHPKFIENSTQYNTAGHTHKQ